MGDRIKTVIDNHVAELVLDRPDKMNAIDEALLIELPRAVRALAEKKDIRCVVLTGAGDHFCAGMDVASLTGELTDNEAFRKRALNLGKGEIANDFQRPAYALRECAVPVIAALRGVAFGGGCQTALAADIRIAAPDARLSVMEIKWGLVPDMGLTLALPRLVGIDVAKELVLTGRIVEAKEALELGLITRIDPEPLTAARKLAREIAEKSPDAIRQSKALLDHAWHMNPAESLALEAELQARVIGRPNQLEAVEANLEKRKPVFGPAGAGPA
jgi:enoyl-CoA hydratase/carnithine racemase